MLVGLDQLQFFLAALSTLMHPGPCTIAQYFILNCKYQVYLHIYNTTKLCVYRIWLRYQSWNGVTHIDKLHGLMEVTNDLPMT